MTEDKDIKINLKYLDDIVSYLVHSVAGYSLPFATLYKWKFGRELDEDKKSHAIGYLRSIKEHKTINEFFENVSDNTFAQGEKLVEALYYLDRQGIVRLDEKFNIKLTFGGIIKHSNSFIKEYNNQVVNEKFNKWNILITILISVLALIAGILFSPC